jgi:hypothetical protein
LTYENIQPPFTLEFFKMAKADLRAYNEWFHEVLPERRRVLADAIGTTPGFGKWNADMTPGSLAELGRWCHAMIKSRPTSEKE